MAYLPGDKFIPKQRTSTPEPVGVPRFETEVPTDIYDFGTLFADQEYAPQPEPYTPQFSFGQRLKLDRLTLTDTQQKVDRKSMFDQQMQEWERGKTLYGGSQKLAGLATTSGKGGGGARAYGVSGTTGLPQHRGSAPYGFQPKMWAALQAANNALKAAGLGGFGITDGFRSYAQQVDVKKRKPGLAARPGTSIHGTGYAADLKLSNAQAEWLRKNGAKFGLYAPIYKKESWHWQLLPSLV